MEKQAIRIGNFYGFDGCSFDETVWHRKGCCPVIRASSGSHGCAPYTICKIIRFGNEETNHHRWKNREYRISKQRQMQSDSQKRDNKSGICGSLSRERSNGSKKMGKWKIKKALNTMPDGTCRTLKSQYHKNSAANFIREGTFGATGVLRSRNAKKDNSNRSDG